MTNDDVMTAAEASGILRQCADTRAMWRARQDRDEEWRPEAYEFGHLLALERMARGIVAVTAERDALRAIIEGRTTPPTEAEVDAHAAAGCVWRWQNLPGDPAGPRWGTAFADEVEGFRRFPLRWWALDAQGVPTAWPVVPPPRE